MTATTTTSAATRATADSPTEPAPSTCISHEVLCPRPKPAPGLRWPRFPARGWRRSVLLFSLASLLTFALNLGFALYASARGARYAAERSSTPAATKDAIAAALAEIGYWKEQWALINGIGKSRGIGADDTLTSGLGLVSDDTPAGDSIGVLVEDDCGRVRTLNTVLHALINLLSAVLLAGSNYCMQCLSSPTRSQVDAAHARGRWMHIGVPSLRNMTYALVSWRHGVLWVLLGASSLPLHLFYNSAVFASVSANAYNVWMVNEDWRAPSNGTADVDRNFAAALPYLRGAVASGRWDRLTTTECIDRYGVAFQSKRSDVILVTGEDMNPFLTPLMELGAQLELSSDGHCPSYQAFQWMCLQHEPYNTDEGFNVLRGVVDENDHGICQRPCEQMLDRLREDAAAGDWKPFEKRVKYCYSLPSDEHCRLHVSTRLMYTVTALNLFKAFLMLIVATRWRNEGPLLTIGDAVRSFMERPDLTTAGMCLTAQDTVDSHWGRGSKIPYPSVFTHRQRRTRHAASLHRWFWLFVLLAVALAVCGALFAHGYSMLRGDKRPADILQLGLGQVSSTTIIISSMTSGRAVDLLANIMLANLPQLVFSLLYFSFNGIFTSMSLASEWSRFAIHRKGLRLSTSAADPASGSTHSSSAQRPTYFLQLPLRRAVPLLVFSSVVHWLLSEAIFLIYIETHASAPFDAFSAEQPVDALIPLRARSPAPGAGPQLISGPLTDVWRLMESYWPFPQPRRACNVDGKLMVGGVGHPAIRNASSVPPPLLFEPGSMGGGGGATGSATWFDPWMPATVHARRSSPFGKFWGSTVFSDFSTLGWSPSAVLGVIAAGVVAMLVTLWVGWGTRLESGDMPIAGSCSAALSAACHLPVPADGGDGRTEEEEEEEDMTQQKGASASRRETESEDSWAYDKEGGRRPWERPLKWGVVFEPKGDIPGRCAFSPGPVGMPVEGSKYA